MKSETKARRPARCRSRNGVPSCSIPAVVHHRDPVRHGQRLLLVVGDVDQGDGDLALQLLELELHRLAQALVERAPAARRTAARSAR